MKPEEFRPVWNEDVFVQRVFADGRIVFVRMINSSSCLTESSAQDLVKVLGQTYSPVVFDSFQFGLGAGLSESEKVPYLRIAKDGATIEINAGDFATSYYGKSGPDQTPEQIAGTAKYYDGRARADLDQRLLDAKPVTP